MNSDCILIMGSNAAECHPVGFQWVVEAQGRGARVIHVDPRFTRTSALSDLHVPIRAGTDIAFLGGIIHHILENGLEFREYVQHYTNAATIVTEAFADTEDLDGLFSGWNAEDRSYDVHTWQYDGCGPATKEDEVGPTHPSGEQSHGAHGAMSSQGDAPERDPTLRHPRCVFQILRRHFRRYTPEMVEEICGVPREEFLEVARALCANSGRERTSCIVYAVGWTQHTTGVQIIRAASIVQTLLGNIGRPGGGILAFRGHASIQGSTDIPTLFNILPGYLPMPNVHAHDDLECYIRSHGAETGLWGRMDAYMVSFLKAWWGDAATPENDFCFGRLPRIDGDHSSYPTMMRMRDGGVDGFFVMGENPAVGSANAALNRRAMASLKWLVVRDMQEVETASFWYAAPEIETGELRTEDIATEVFFLPAATHVEKDGTLTNTHRLLQWHNKAVEPPGDCRSELWFMYHLGRRVRERLAASEDPRDRGILDLTWDYPTEGEIGEPSAAAVLREVNGWGADGRALGDYTQLRADGSTASGCWIYCGCYGDEVNQTARRTPGSEQTWIAPEWGWAWPVNRRILYNRASADPQGRPWSERKRRLWWDAERGRWTGPDVPDMVPDKPPDYVPPEGAKAEDALRGDDPFLMQPDGKAWLYVPSGLVDGPLPAHYEPHESPVRNRLYGQDSNPARQLFPRADNPYNPKGSPAFPFVLTSYRLTEHQTAGGMSRYVPHLAELQPELFCEVSPELAQARGLRHGGWATIVTARLAVEARVLVSERMTPLDLGARTVHQVGIPYHYGPGGLARGDTPNDLFAVALDPNVHIQESKVATCDIRAGRRPRGPALIDLVAEARRAAAVAADGEPT
ncbi:MAG: formate dehydrogenase major subunit [Solirubrobacteraceae bacterium]|nr:formate dehydrogenase major subunit [Solirubrobacteraceae bacterium]